MLYLKAMHDSSYHGTFYSTIPSSHLGLSKDTASIPTPTSEDGMYHGLQQTENADKEDIKEFPLSKTVGKASYPIKGQRIL